MEDAIRGIVPFLIAECAVVVLLVLFPAIVTVPVKWLF
jgi:TRAP-type C4-dicarboxylate transport system permease large subunit